MAALLRIPPDLLRGRPRPRGATLGRLSPGLAGRRIQRWGWFPGLLAVAAGIAWAEPTLAGTIDTAPSRRAEEPPGPKPSPLELFAEPVLGSNTPAGLGWIGYLVTLHNHGASAVSGHVQLEAVTAGSPRRAHVYSRAPFRLGPRSSIRIELLAHDTGTSGVRVSAIDPVGQLLTHADAEGTMAQEPLLVDLDPESTLAERLQGQPVLTHYMPTPYGRYSSPRLTRAWLQTRPNGRPFLPSTPAGYANATLVLAKSSELLALPSRDLTALVGWVIGGGSLAVVIDRENDLKSAVLPALAGGPIEVAPAPGDLVSTFEVTRANADAALPLKSRVATVTLGPTRAVVEDLVSYAGGNLHPSPWGTSASYGLGELHLLAFDPSDPEYEGDRWVELQLLSLVGYAWDRTAQLAYPVGSVAYEDRIADEVRRVLDPNEGTLWTIGLAGVLLVLYAFAAGPINFYVARNQGQPVRALYRVPLLALITALLIGLIGLGAKGGSGRCRRLTLIEAGAGMPVGSAVRFRAFFASDSDTLRVAPSLSLGLIDVLGPRDQATRTLTLGPQGPELEQFRSKPWQTVVIREDGLSPLGGGIVIRREQGSLVVRNLTGHDLVAAILHMPGGDLRFFPRIVAGQKAVADDGEVLIAGTGSAAQNLHPLETTGFKYRLNREAPQLSEAFTALARASRRAIDWWPAEAPVLMAMLDKPAAPSDSNFRVDQDRVLVRVVGYGGAP